MVRLKQRYILFDILYPPTSKGGVSSDEFLNFSNSSEDALLTLHQTSPTSINQKTLTNAIRRNILDHFGEFGSGMAGMQLTVKYFSNKTSTGIIRCGRQSYHLVVAALTLIDKIEDTNVLIRCTRVSGTIKKCEEYSIARTKELMYLINKNSKEQKDLNNLMSTFEGDVEDEQSD